MSDNGTPSGALVRETYGIAPSMVRRNGASDVYCVTGLPFRPHNVQATADTGPTVEGYPQGYVSQEPTGGGMDFCSTAHERGRASAETRSPPRLT